MATIFDEATALLRHNSTPKPGGHRGQPASHYEAELPYGSAIEVRTMTISGNIQYRKGEVVGGEISFSTVRPRRARLTVEKDATTGKMVDMRRTNIGQLEQDLRSIAQRRRRRAEQGQARRVAR